LGDGTRHSDIRMENLIGADMDRVSELRKTNAALHLYGKSEVKPGRKMGHINFRT
jgi:5-(carboxyamino)imidazole ribonucleotide synthase